MQNDKYTKFILTLIAFCLVLMVSEKVYSWTISTAVAQPGNDYSAADSGYGPKKPDVVSCYYRGKSRDCVLVKSVN